MAVKEAITPQQAAGILKRTRNDPSWFMREVLGEKPPLRFGLYDKQLQILNTLRDHRRVAVCGANSTGKDWLAGRIVLWWLSAFKPAKCIIFGKTFRQVQSIVWKETRLAYQTSLIPLGGRMLDNPRWDLSDEHFALGFSVDSPMSILGFHSPHLLIIVTEAHAVGQEDIESLKRLNPERILLSGNPFCEAGEFYDAFHIKSDLYHPVLISAFDTPNVKAGRMIVPGMVTLEDIEERKREWGEDNPLYEGGVLGKFPSSLENTLIARSWVDAALRAESTVEKSLSPIVACDVARFGSDRTVVVRRDDARARIIWRVQGRDTMQIAGWLNSYCHDNPAVKQVIVDDTGVGGGVTDRLREFGIQVVAFQGGASATRKDRYANATAEAWGEMAQAFKEGQIAIENDLALVGQLCARRYKIQSDRTIALESKDDLKKRGGKSPDEADALSMTFAPFATGTLKAIGQHHQASPWDLKNPSLSFETFSGKVGSKWKL